LHAWTNKNILGNFPTSHKPRLGSSSSRIRARYFEDRELQSGAQGPSLAAHIKDGSEHVDRLFINVTVSVLTAPPIGAATRPLSTPSTLGIVSRNVLSAMARSVGVLVCVAEGCTALQVTQPARKGCKSEPATSSFLPMLRCCAEVLIIAEAEEPTARLG
jgi:hypothetical protein